jgi:hypothetical protein
MTTKDKFIQLSVIHSTKRENQTIIGLTAEGKIYKGVIYGIHVQNTNDFKWQLIDLPEELQ